ncbi:T9SS type A sorting domain-containing protein [Hymenobacter guriensis]|uniref:T9SS type A sorting domain-containing protein n=1 Tax=Hymenobacter guriensis TaxID=2793065 RepID=A0ABS0L2M4_9BACT|nr:T9SS type A sorting domain-containing protein [Hymenobacter guriensis]MBG8553679.1 T9SS type A sorting domain-containing protein [Hymenobacter guriensis]
MPRPATPRLRTTLGLLTGLLAGHGAAAQTAPAWTSAYATGVPMGATDTRIMDADGNVYEVGLFGSQVSLGYSSTGSSTTLSTKGGWDGYLAKYTPTGTLAWVHQFGSAGTDRANGVAVDAAGNVYVTGSFQHAIELDKGQTLDAGSYPGEKTFVARYDAQGTLSWARQSDTPPSYPINCPPGSMGESVSLDAEGNVVVTGGYISPDGISFGGQQLAPISNLTTPYVTFSVRLSAATGAVQTLRNVFYSDRATGAGVIYFPQLLNAPNGGQYIVTNYLMAPSFETGKSLPAPKSVQVLVARYNAAGQLEWARTFGGADYSFLGQAATDAAGNLYINGTFRESLHFASTNVTGGGDNDGFLVKYSPQGTEQWVQTVVSPEDDMLYGLYVDAGGNSYVTGAFSSQARVGSATLTSAGNKDVLVAAYSPQGQLRWVQQAGGPGQDWGMRVSASAQGRLRVFGQACYYLSFGPDFDPIQGDYVGFMAEIGITALAALPTQPARPLPQGMYPNPATDQVRLPGLPTGTRVQLLDALGRIAHETTVSAAAQVSVLGLAPGLYTLRATDKQGLQYAARLAVE